MGIVGSFMDHRVSAELNERGVLVWYDPARTWQPWIQAVHGESPRGEEATAAQVTIGGHDAHLVISTGSQYEILQTCERLSSGSERPRLLVYVPGEPYIETLSPLRELECLGGEREPYQRDLTQVARQAFQSADLSEAKIDQLLNREGLDFAYLDSIAADDGAASPLSPVFGSSRELDVIPSFLADSERKGQAAKKGLLSEVAALVEASLGFWLADAVGESTPTASAKALSEKLGRALLVAEMRSDLEGEKPVEISQIPGPQSDEQVERVRAVCGKLRREYPDAYEELADSVERELGLAQAQIDPEKLGRIDTFRFEERRLLEACDGLLAKGEAGRALSIVESRLKEGSFWASVSRFPARHAAWQACSELAQLALGVERVAKALEKPPSDSSGWIAAYTAAEGWHRVDQGFREARYRLSRIEDAATLERGAERVFQHYDRLLERMATGFTEVLKEGSWQAKGVLRQEEVYERHLARRAEPVAYLLADAMRFEMGAELARLIEAVGATAVHLTPAVAVSPTITDLGMAALLPGADRSFSMAESKKGGTGAIGGKPLVGSAERMDHAKGAVPGLVEITLDHLVQLSAKKREEEIQGAPIVVIRSQEIDGAGENLPAGVAQKVMGTILEDLRSAIQSLAEAGIKQFVVAADHGHLFSSARGDDMKIDPPEGGKKVDLHRRCWVGRGGSTPSSCVRLSASDLGYEGTDLELVVPKGAGVFKAGGSLAFHHGGLTLQELIIPVLTFELEGKRASKKKGAAELLTLEAVPKEITNRIFSIRLKTLQLQMFDPLSLRVIAQATGDKGIAAQAAWASEGWDSEGRVITLVSGEPVDVRLLLDDDTVQELRILVIEVGTDRVLKDSQPIPVKVIS